MALESTPCGTVTQGWLRIRGGSLTQGHHPTKGQWSFPLGNCKMHCQRQAFLPLFLRGANGGDGDPSPLQKFSEMDKRR